MQFRLRTLLIVMTIIGTVLGRVAYLKRQADSHRLAINRFFSPIVPNGMTVSELNAQLEREAAIGPGAGYRYDVPHIQLPMELGDRWSEARQHAILARRYERAMYLPWTSVWDDPNSVPDSVSFIDFRFAAFLVTAVALAIAASPVIARLAQTNRRIDAKT